MQNNTVTLSLNELLAENELLIVNLRIHTKIPKWNCGLRLGYEISIF